jgi:hypothetical protein
MGIPGNEAADAAAETAIHFAVLTIPNLPRLDVKGLFREKK